MRSRLAHEDSGSVLVAAVLVLMITLGLGVALAATVNTQVHAAKYERNRESSFTLTEASLNAQALQLGRQWPTRATPAPSSCDPSVNNAACPLSTAITNGYTANDYNSSCPRAPSTPIWKTQVRDNVNGEKYWSTAVNSRGSYDGANDGTPTGDGAVWVRATATVQCRVQSIVTLVRNDPLPGIDFPQNVITANFFQTTNQGRKVLVDTLGSYAQPPSSRPGPSGQPAAITLRCTGVTKCADYNASKGQVQPPKVITGSQTSTSSLSPSQLLQLKAQAVAAGTYYATGSCPAITAAGLSSANGAPVYVEGPCNISVNSNTVINSAPAPGALIIVNGTFSISGSAYFYGLLYAVNAQGSTSSVVNVTGNGSIQGLVSVDGAGGVTVGGSATGIVYDSKAGHLLKGSAGATPAKGTWRQLPANTP